MHFSKSIYVLSFRKKTCERLRDLQKYVLSPALCRRLSINKHAGTSFSSENDNNLDTNGVKNIYFYPYILSNPPPPLYRTGYIRPDPFFIVTYYIKWVTASWTYSITQS